MLTVHFADEAAGFLPPGAFESFRDDLGLTYSRASAVLVVAAPGAIVGNVFAVLADYRSRRAIAAGGALAFAAALFVFAATSSWWAMLVAGFTLGCASTAMCDATEIAFVEVVGPDATSHLSRAFLLGSVGDLAGPVLLVAAATTGLGWRGAFALAAVGMTAYACWLATVPFPAPHPRAPDDGSARAHLAEIVRDRRVWLVGVLALLLGPLDEDYFAFLIAYLRHDHGLGEAGATAVAMLSVVGTFAGFASTSRPGYSPGPRALPGAAAALAGAAVVAAVVPSVVAIGACTFVIGAAMARFWVALKARSLALRPRERGSVQAVVTTIEYSGFALPLAAGALADAFGVRAGFGFSALVAVALLVLSLAGTRRARRQARIARAI
jgi:predicted MFS family arabinose efflux permease